MSTVGALMLLLLLSFLGSSVASGGSGRGTHRRGLPSGSEFLLLGLIVGPLALDAVTRKALVAFDPLAYVAVGWLALNSGLEFGWVGNRRVTTSRILAGVALAVSCGGAVAVATWFVSPSLAALSDADRLLLAGGVGCVCAESTWLGVRWNIERHGASGPLTDLVHDLAHSDELVPIAVIGLLFALRVPADVTVQIPALGWAAATLAVGALLGILTALLLALDLRVTESWGTVLGTTLRTIGLAARLDLAGVTALFVLGASIAWSSRHRGDIRAMVVKTERAVLLPALVLAGARIDPASLGRLAFLIPIAIGVRVAMKMVSGAIIARHPAARGAGPLLGVGLISAGGMSLMIGLALALQFPGPVGDTALATAIAATVVGEIAGPLALKRVLTRAGEIAQSSPEPEPEPQPEPVPEVAAGADAPTEEAAS